MVQRAARTTTTKTLAATAAQGDQMATLTALRDRLAAQQPTFLTWPLAVACDQFVTVTKECAVATCPGWTGQPRRMGDDARTDTG